LVETAGEPIPDELAALMEDDDDDIASDYAEPSTVDQDLLNLMDDDDEDED
jgi:hypothetical protein